MNVAGGLGLAAILADEQEEDEERIIKIANLRRRRLMRSVALLFRTLSDTQFAKKLRFPKELSHWLCEIISPRLPNQGRGSHISKEIQILSTLRFYATGTFQESLGDFSYTCYSQGSMGKIINKVTLAILILQNDWVKFPVDPQELQRISAMFEEHIGFPRVIGAIDCTHVAMRGPHAEKWNYLNYNRYYSTNVQVTCDDKLRITSLDTYPGTTHDSTLWRNSQVKKRIDRFNEGGQESNTLMADIVGHLSGIREQLQQNTDLKRMQLKLMSVATDNVSTFAHYNVSTLTEMTHQRNSSFEKRKRMEGDTNSCEKYSHKDNGNCSRMENAHSLNEIGTRIQDQMS